MTTVLSKMENVKSSILSKKKPVVEFTGVSQGFEEWLKLAETRIFSLAAGNRIGKIAPQLMQVGFGKILYAATQVGVDIEQSNPFVLFAPDGTCSYNVERTKRGFSYGGILDFDFNGLLASNNSMPNGCGFSIYRLIDPPSDGDLKEYLKDSQERLGQEQISQLATGNHFAGLYHVLDPLSGEDTNERFVVIHCSGHAGGDRLYFPEHWLADEEGYQHIDTPHGPIRLLEGEAKKRYLAQFAETDKINSRNRDITMEEIFPDKPWERLEEITHQGLFNDGNHHVIGAQVHKGLMPVAFNPEEGLSLVTTKPNLNSDFISQWDQGNRVYELGLEKKLTQINLTPHGGGYEFRQPVRSLKINLNQEGIKSFDLTLDTPDLNNMGPYKFEYFKQIRDLMTYRRKFPVMKEIFKAELANMVYELPSLMQIYPLKSIPGGSHEN